MSVLEVSIHSSADPAKAWALLANFGAIDAFNPNLKRSYVVGDGPDHGNGAQRHCDLADGRNYIKERVIDWQDGRSYTVDFVESSMPFKRAHVTLRVEPEAQGSRLTMALDYELKHGPLGRLMNLIVMRHVMKKTMMKLLKGLDDTAREHPFPIAAYQGAG